MPKLINRKINKKSFGKSKKDTYICNVFNTGNVSPPTRKLTAENLVIANDSG
jgi:hypothetical protein